MQMTKIEASVPIIDLRYIGTMCSYEIPEVTFSPL